MKCLYFIQKEAEFLIVRDGHSEAILLDAIEWAMESFSLPVQLVSSFPEVLIPQERASLLVLTKN